MNYKELFMRKDRAERLFRIRASIFYIIFAVTIFNTVLFHLGSTFFIGFGLGTAMLIDSLLQGFGVLGPIGAITVNLVLAWTFLQMGKAASQKKTSIYLFGLVLYVLDTIILWKTAHIIGMAFRVFSLWHLFRGYWNLQNFLVLEAEEESAVNDSKTAFD